MVSQAKKGRFVAALTELGGSADNVRLRKALKWAEETYNAVKDDLLAEGIITPGRGFARLSLSQPKAPVAPRPIVNLRYSRSWIVPLFQPRSSTSLPQPALRRQISRSCRTSSLPKFSASKRRTWRSKLCTSF
jgi:hypothetical protein